MKQKSFDDMRCSVARTLEHVGAWWTLLIVRDCMLGMRRFKEFESSLGIAKTTLSRRLNELVDTGILRKVPSSEGYKYEEYELTKKGTELAPIVIALGQWGDKWAAHENGPSIRIHDSKTGKDISRLWPTRSDGQEITIEELIISQEAS